MGTVGVIVLLAFGVAAGAFAAAWLARGRRRGAAETITTEAITEQVRAVGRLVGLEVCAKEIATATRGWAWLPPLLLSQARLAMIFSFEKQYAVDLARLGRKDVEDLGGGRFRLRLPPLQGTLRLIDVTPYDIQDGRVLGLLDVIQMTAERQKELMSRAQAQAAELYAASEARYTAEARRSVERQLATLLGLFGLQVELEWGEGRREGIASGRAAEGRPVLALAG